MNAAKGHNCKLAPGWTCNHAGCAKFEMIAVGVALTLVRRRWVPVTVA